MRECHFSVDRSYRYRLSIIWDASLPPQMFIGLNPSTADEVNDDPTIRRCIDYSKRWGAGGLVMCNAFAYRATDPEVMLAAEAPVGPQNTIDHLRGRAFGTFNRPIAAWGQKVIRWNRSYANDLKRFDGGLLDCLRINADGTPCHPLYLPKILTPIPFNYTKAVA